MYKTRNTLGTISLIRSDTQVGSSVRRTGRTGMKPTALLPVHKAALADLLPLVFWFHRKRMTTSRSGAEAHSSFIATETVDLAATPSSGNEARHLAFAQVLLGNGL